MPLKSSIKSLKQTFTRRFEGARGIDFLLIASILAAVVLVGAIAVTYYMATQQKLSAYVTPIPLTQKEYARGEVIAGYYEGRKIYDGAVEITRQISCNDGYVETLPDLRTGDLYTKSILPAREIDGTMARNIAEIPENVTQGTSCIIAFDHQACIEYLFGCYEQHYTYVSLPFTIAQEPTGATIRDEMNIPASGAEAAPQRIPTQAEGLTAPPIQNNSAAAAEPTTPSPVGGETVPMTTTPETPSASGPDVVQKVIRGVNNIVTPIVVPVDGLLNSITGRIK